MDFSLRRSFDPKKDKLSELPIYDQLDWLLIFFNAPNNRKGASIIDAAYFVEGFSSHTEVELSEPISDDLIEDIKLLVIQLLEDKYLKGINPDDIGNSNNRQLYKPTYKARVYDEGMIYGYRMSIYNQQSEERNIARLRQRQDELTTSTLQSNKMLIRIFIVTAFFAGISAYIANENYNLELLKRIENDQAKEALQKIRQQDLALRSKNDTIQIQLKKITSLQNTYDSLKALNSAHHSPK